MSEDNFEFTKRPDDDGKSGDQNIGGEGSASGNRKKARSVSEIVTDKYHENLVIFVGPKEVGKTVSLIRLTHFLNQNREVRVKPNEHFRVDADYPAVISDFLNDVNRPDFSPNRTGNINFILLDVFKGGSKFCQFLEAPGEAFFDVNNPHSQGFPTYMSKIINRGKLKKVYVLFFEEGMLMRGDKGYPRAYSTKLATLVGKMDRKKDDVIILFNKADKHRDLFESNRPNVKEFKKLLYEDENYHAFLGALNSSKVPVRFVPFTNGDFHEIPNSQDERWIHSDDFYPSTLWKNIESSFRSFRWF